MPLYSSLGSTRLQYECSWKNAQGSRGIPETFAEKHNNISLYCRFKELSVRGLKTANRV